MTKLHNKRNWVKRTVTARRSSETTKHRITR